MVSWAEREGCLQNKYEGAGEFTINSRRPSIFQNCRSSPLMCFLHAHLCIVDYHSCLAKRKVAGDVTASSSTTGITVTFSSYRAASNYSSTAANDFKAASVAENRKDCTTSVLVTNVAWAGGISFVAVCVIVYLVYLVLTRRRSTITTNQPERGRLGLLLAPHKFRIRETDTNSATLSFVFV